MNFGTVDQECRDGERRFSNAASTESREARSTLIRTMLTFEMIDSTSMTMALAQVSSRPVKCI